MITVAINTFPAAFGADHSQWLTARAKKNDSQIFPIWPLFAFGGEVADSTDSLWETEFNIPLECILLLAPSAVDTFSNFQILRILKCLKDPTCAIFLKSMGFKDIKYDIPVYQMWNTQIHKYANKFTHYIYWSVVRLHSAWWHLHLPPPYDTN